MPPQLTKPLLLRGRVVHPDGSARDRFVLVRQGKIESVTRNRPPLSDDAVFIETESEDWIFPGLINLHSHSDYNLLPIWDSPDAPFNNRFEWRRDTGYKDNVRGVYSHLVKPEYKKVLSVFAELQAIAGGTSILQESKDLDAALGIQDGLLICRDTASASDLGLPANKVIYSPVDFFRPNSKGDPAPVESAIKGYERLRDKGNLQATLLHLAEGRTGFGQRRLSDSYSRAEFEAFMNLPIMKKAEEVRSNPISLIHCSGFDPASNRHIQFLKERAISIVWSPVSNFLLYGDTLDIEAILHAGINVTIGSDWAPSGSKHVWDEAKFVRRYLSALNSAVSDEQIFRMVTSNAAKCLGMPKLGRIEEGALADFFILRSPLESDNPLEVFFGTTDSNVQGVVIAGVPTYGSKDFMKQFSSSLQSLPTLEGSAVKNKVIHLPKQLNIDVDKDITTVEKLLKELPQKQKRSNLLSSSDTPYRRRISNLLTEAIKIGWRTNQWRHEGSKKFAADQIPVTPKSVRVWRGFKTSTLSSQSFRSKLGKIFMPSTAIFMGPLGLTAYLPSVLPDEKDPILPDEIALVFYETQDAYKQARKALAARVYGELHGAVFNLKKSHSDFPALFKGQFQADTPYYLIEQNVDWHEGESAVFVGVRKPSVKQEQFLPQTAPLLSQIQKSKNSKLDGAFVVGTSDYLVFWYHSKMTIDTNSRHGLEATCDIVMHLIADKIRAPTQLYRHNDGVAVSESSNLNFQFLRRQIYPY